MNASQVPQKYEAAQLFSTLIISVSCGANQHIRMIFSLKIQLCITGINYILKYIQLEKVILKVP